MSWKVCEDEEIGFQLTIAYSSQQNGVLKKKKNRIVMKMTKLMLKEKSLANTFWDEMIYIIFNILNKCPTKIVQDKTSIEVWSKRKPQVKHLISFHIYLLHICIWSQKPKLEDTTIREIFWIYNTQLKGYKVFNI